MSSSTCLSAYSAAPLGVLLLATVVSFPAALVGLCMPAGDLAERLRVERGEVVEREEIDARGKVVQWWAGPGGTWSIVIRHPADRGAACLIAQSGGEPV